ncbi:LOW QUALITY PROTEIN: hypothetical protein CFOL_v3_10972, partial [Cephalotus follicularis]
WKLITNHSQSLLGRIWILWNPSALQLKSMPWIVIGDYNVSRWPNEHSGRRPVFSKAMSEFGDCIRKCEIQDLRQTGCFFSWSNKRVGDEAVSKKLDRAMGNWGWFKEFNHVQASFPTPGLSDHSPCILQFKIACRSGSRPFKYLNVWASHPEFLDVVRHVWAQSVEGNPLEAVSKKLRMLKPALKEFHKRHFNNLTTESAKIKQLIDIQQATLDEDPSNGVARSIEKRLLGEYHEACSREEAYLKQKARVNCFNLGDSNSAFFHRAVKLRQARNFIGKIQKAEGNWTRSEEEVGEETVNYFSNLFRNPQRRVGIQLKQFGAGIKEDQKMEMGKEVSLKEIEEALWSQKLDKAPPDGFNGHFFKDACIVGVEVLHAIKSFFETEDMPRGTNATILCLIPKVPSPSTMKDFRPIACCSFLYKTIS